MGANDYAIYLEETAMGIAVEAKAVEFCRVHPSIFVRLGDEDAEVLAYKMATRRFQDGKLECDLKDIRDAIKDVFDTAADEQCPDCAHLAEA